MKVSYFTISAFEGERRDPVSWTEIPAGDQIHLLCWSRPAEIRVGMAGQSGHPAGKLSSSIISSMTFKLSSSF